MAPSVALLCNNAASVRLFRGPLVTELVRRGCRVAVFAPDYTPADRECVIGLGAEPVDFRLDRTGANPFREAGVVLELARLLRSRGIEVCLGFMTKLVIYGALAGLLARVPRRFGMVEGLGFFFTADTRKPGFRTALIRRVIIALYRLTLPLNHRLFLLNPDDASDLAQAGALGRTRVTVLAPGIGIDTRAYAPAPPVTDPLSFLFVGRLLGQKGVREFAQAAELVRKRHPETRFKLVGPEDTNPGGIAASEVKAWVERDILEWPGAVPDARPWYRSASVFVLPSYREGMPRTTLEALAMARPIVTTDVPGCRETVVHGENGFLVPPRDPEALAAALERFIQEPGLVARMGAASRRLAEQRFDVRLANDTILKEMDL